MQQYILKIVKILIYTFIHQLILFLKQNIYVKINKVRKQYFMLWQVNKMDKYKNYQKKKYKIDLFL